MTGIPYHPLLFALFPVLSLIVQNSEQLTFLEWLQPAVVVLGLAGILWLATSRWLHDGTKSAIISSILLVLFFSFSRVLDAVTYELYSVPLVGQRAFVVESTFGWVLWAGFCLVLFGVAIYLVVKSSSDLKLLTQFLNIFTLALILIVLANWLVVRLNDRAAYSYVEAWHNNAFSAQPSKDLASTSDPSPDIYYIILDGYGRADILDSLYHLDNSPFYSFLTRTGFYIADQSHANYMQTPLSLASSLNSIYLDSIDSQIGDQSGNRLPLGAMIEDNRLFRQLRDRRYAVVTFSTGFDLTDIKSSDDYLSPPGALDAFQNAFLGTTPLPLFLDLPFLKSQYELHRERILYDLDDLPDVTKINGPKLVFCHILAPHPPFVFGANGEPIQPDSSFDLSDGSSYTARMSESDYVEGYKNQLLFVTARVQLMISQILARSPNPPVIIIQGDHGPGSRLDWTNVQNTYLPERLSILNAYYFPDQDYSLLYPSITPVNSFRVVLSRYFGVNLPLLPDHSYFSTLGRPYTFIDVTDQLAVDPQP